jgi:hypothetical protein
VSGNPDYSLLTKHDWPLGYLSGSFFPEEQLLSGPAGLWMDMILAIGTNQSGPLTSTLLTATSQTQKKRNKRKVNYSLHACVHTSIWGKEGVGKWKARLIFAVLIAVFSAFHMLSLLSRAYDIYMRLSRG